MDGAVLLVVVPVSVTPWLGMTWAGWRGWIFSQWCRNGGGRVGEEGIVGQN